MTSKKCADINIITYNIFCRPSYACYDEQHKRAKLIPKTLFKCTNGFNNIDIICFIEAFDHDVNDILTVELYKYGFKYSTNLLNTYSLVAFKLINSGIRIFSKHPILRSEFRLFPFKAYTNLESYVGKGVLAIKIKPENSIIDFNILATHLIAWNNKESIMCRKEQIDIIDNFIKEMKLHNIIKKKEPIIITGDFNIDITSKNKNEIKYLIKNLKSTICKKFVDKIKIKSYCKKHNQLIGRDGESRHSINEMLDYTLIRNNKYNLIKSHKIKVLKPYKFVDCKNTIFYDDTYMKSKNLSDHFPTLNKIKLHIIDQIKK